MDARRSGAERLPRFRRQARRGRSQRAEFDHDQPWISERLREELFITAFSKEDSDRLAFQNDPEVAKGAASLPASKAMLNRAHEIVSTKKVASNEPVQ